MTAIRSRRPSWLASITALGFAAVACSQAALAANEQFVEVAAQASTYVQSGTPDTNHASAVELRVRRFDPAGPGNPDVHLKHAVALLGFDLGAYAGKDVVQARLVFDVVKPDDSPMNDSNKYYAKTLRLLPARDLASVTYNSLRLPLPTSKPLLDVFDDPVVHSFVAVLTPTPAHETEYRARVTATGQGQQARVEIDLGNRLQALGGHAFALAIEDWRPRHYNDFLRILSRHAAPGSRPRLQLTLVDRPASPLPDKYQLLAQQRCDSDSHLRNGLAGLHEWRGDNFHPGYVPARDVYERFNWNQLETAPGDYHGIQTAIIDRLAALQPGQKFAFRVRAMIDNGNVMPADLQDAGQGHVQSCEGHSGVPNWSNKTVQNRAQTLIEKIGEALAQAKLQHRIAWIDAGFTGKWGETNGGCTENMSNADRETYIDMYAQAFDGIQLLSMTDDDYMAQYALSKAPDLRGLRFGVRRDSLGGNSLRFGEMPGNFRSIQLILDRWQQAPVVAEFGGAINRHDSMWTLAPGEAGAWHVSTVGNGNTTASQPKNPFDPAAPELAQYRPAFSALARQAGLRLHLARLGLPDQIKAGQPFALYSEWHNDGSAPAYEPLRVELSFRGWRLTDVHKRTLNLDLRQLLPTHNPLTGERRSHERLDELAGLPAGDWQVYLNVLDAGVPAVRQPLALCQAGGAAAFGYPLGSVRVD